MQSALIISEKMQLMCQEMDKGCFFSTHVQDFYHARVSAF